MKKIKTFTQDTQKENDFKSMKHTWPCKFFAPITKSPQCDVDRDIFKGEVKKTDYEKVV